MKITIKPNIQGGYEVDLPEHTKQFYYNGDSNEFSIKFHTEKVSPPSAPANPAVPTTAAVHKGLSSDEEEDEEEVTIADIIDDADGAVFASVAYMDDEPKKKAKRIASLKRNTYGWTQTKKLAHNYACVYDLLDLESCCNAHLAELLDYYIKDKKLIENLLSDMGKKYGTSSRSHRLNYAAHETLEKVRANGNGSYYSEKDLLKPVNERFLITYQMMTIMTTFSYHVKKLRWMGSLGFYFFSKFVFDIIDDGKIKYFNEIPEGFYELNKEIAEKVVYLERQISRDYKIPPKGLFKTITDYFYPWLAEKVKTYIPGFNIDLSSVNYDEFADPPASLKDSLKYKMDATLYARKITGYSELWSKLKLLPGIGKYNIITHARDLNPSEWG